MPLNDVVYGLYRVAQRTVMNASVSGVDLGRLGGDETLRFKTLYVLLHTVTASPDSLGNRGVAGIVPKDFPILAPHPFGIDNNATFLTAQGVGVLVSIRFPFSIPFMLFWFTPSMSGKGNSYDNAMAKIF